MPIGRFAGSILKALPFLGDAYNTYNEYRDQRDAGFSPVKSAARAIPVGVTGMLTNLVDPFGISNVTPEILRSLAKVRQYEEKKGTTKKVFGSPIISAKDPRMLMGAPEIGIGQLFEDPRALDYAARIADQFNTEAYTRSLVDRLDPQTKNLSTSLDINERLRQLREKINPQ